MSIRATCLTPPGNLKPTENVPTMLIPQTPNQPIGRSFPIHASPTKILSSKILPTPTRAKHHLPVKLREHFVGITKGAFTGKTKGAFC